MISNTIHYIGVNDHEIDLFEGQYPVPNGMAYNSYLIEDERIAVVDSVDVRFTREWFANLRAILGQRSPDYLVVQHMEPDHSGSIFAFAEAFPETKIVGTERAFAIMKNFFGTDFSGRNVVVGEGDTLCLGERTLTFYTAPMVHWPEVVMTYDSKDKVLFSADAFGKFGALDVDEPWRNEARRYYIGIVGKFGAPVQSVLKRVSGLEIRTICSLHGPVLKENLDEYLDLYRIWSGYEVEEEGILIAYTSIYGNTKQAVERLAAQLRAQRDMPVVVYDLARCDVYKAVGDAFRYSKLVLATTTYNGGVFPAMREFIQHLVARNFSNRTVALIENGSWAPAAARMMWSMLEKGKNLRFTRTMVRILSALNDESATQLDMLAKELCGEEMGSVDQPRAETKKFVCKICGYIFEGLELPADFVCPICKRTAEYFEELN